MKTTISIDDTTSKRLGYVRDFCLQLDDLDTVINALLDQAGYPTWQEAQALGLKSVARKTRVKARKAEVSA